MLIPIEVYACPTPDCCNYFGTNDMEDLTQKFTGVATENVHAYEQAHGTRHTHSRAICPECKTRGVIVERVRVKTSVLVDAVEPPSNGKPA